jgi:anti-sigma factor RsiW
MHAYVDGELDAAGALEVERHLGECPACASEVARHRSLGTALRSDELYHRAPSSLRERVHAKLGRRRPSIRPMRWAAIAASILVAVCLGFSLGRWTTASTDASLEIVAAHVRSLQAEHLVDVASSDRHRVKPWFAGKLDFSPSVPDLAEHGFTLVGGRLDYLGGRPAAALVYRRREHTINVFLQPARDRLGSTRRTFERDGFRILHASLDGMEYWLVSDVGVADLDELLRLLAAEK